MQRDFMDNSVEEGLLQPSCGDNVNEITPWGYSIYIKEMLTS